MVIFTHSALDTRHTPQPSKKYVFFLSSSAHTRRRNYDIIAPRRMVGVGSSRETVKMPSTLTPLNDEQNYIIVLANANHK